MDGQNGHSQNFIPPTSSGSVKALEWSQHFLIVSLWEYISRCLRAANSTVLGWIWPKFKLNQAFMVVLIMVVLIT